MFQWNALAVLGVIGLSALGACSKESTSSTNIKTGGIAALVDVYAGADAKATVHVELRVGGSDSNTYVILEGGDKLTATVGDVTKPVSAQSDGVFEATFSGVAAEDLFTVNLERPADTNAPGNSGTLPPPYTIAPPPEMKSRSADDLAIAWDPGSDDAMSLEVKGDCTFEFDKVVSDTGAYTIKKGSVDSTGGDMPEACPVTLSMDRTRKGVADSAFDSESYFRMHQQRSATIKSSLP